MNSNAARQQRGLSAIYDVTHRLVVVGGGGRNCRNSCCDFFVVAVFSAQLFALSVKELDRFVRAGHLQLPRSRTKISNVYMYVCVCVYVCVKYIVHSLTLCLYCVFVYMKSHLLIYHR